MGFLPLSGRFSAHLKGNASLVAARDGNACVSYWAKEGGHDQACVQSIHDAGHGRFRLPKLHRGRIHTLGQDLVYILGHNRPVGLAVKGEYFSAILFHGVLRGLGDLCLVEHVGQIGNEEGNLHPFSAGCFFLLFFDSFFYSFRNLFCSFFNCRRGFFYSFFYSLSLLFCHGRLTTTSD